MKLPSRHILAACVLAQVGLCGVGAAEPAPATQLGDQIIPGKSIFLRDRQTRVKSAEIADPPQLIEERFVLRGVVFEDNSFWAYVEGPGPANAQRVKVGDFVADGQVTEIGMDGIRYRKDGENQSRSIGPGRNFSGGLLNLRESRR